MAISPDILATLAATPAEFERLFRSVPPAHAQWKPQSWEGVPGEMFSALEQACHLRDIEVDGYQVRLRRTLEEAGPLLPSLDGYALAEERRYRDADPAEVLAAFATARKSTLRLIQSLSDGDLARQAVFEGYGPVTVRGLVQFLCSHDRQHLACMHWLLGKLDAHLAAA
jgi:hypothetical protein